MKIGELARRCGVSEHTLRYYERIGLLPRPPRAASGHREYDPAVLVWIEFLGRLKTTGMPIAGMLEYARLRDQGPATASARRRLLEAHRDGVRAHVAELQACLAVLDTKIAGYAGDAQVETDHDDASDTDREPLRDRPARSVGG